jgi:hypothetical protein
MSSGEPGSRAWAPVLLDSVAIALLAAALIFPLFKAVYFDNWPSIESTFIADGRFLAEHWGHPLWQPLWYGGTRFDYVYPPALRYGVAGLARTFQLEPVRAYHVFIALLYAIGIAGVYVLVRAGSGSRRAGWVGAAAAALVSPCFLLMPTYAHGSEHLVPQRLHVLVRYGEGPHISALALLPFALAAAWMALRGRRPWALGLAAALAAAIALTNFYGATALAVFFPILAWSVWIAYRDGWVWLRAAGIAALAYGLTAFWLTPSYLRFTLANLRLVAAPGNAWSRWAALGVAALFTALSWRWAHGRKERAWPVFVCGAAVFFSLAVPGGHYFGFRLAGDTHRLVPELDLALILLCVEGLRLLWRARSKRFGWAPRALAVILLLASFGPSRHYLRRAWEIYPSDPNYRNRVEYRIPDRIARDLAGSRVFVSGSIRFWYDAWRDLPQVGGGAEQGLLNPSVMPALWEVLLGPRAEPGVLWLKALGADAVVVVDKTSQEAYHDFQYPRKFAGALPVFFDDGKGDVIYRVPRRYPALARVVDCARAEALGPIRYNDDVERLGQYVEALESGPPSPVEMSWEGTDAIRLRTALAAGQCLLVQVSYDPAWRAYAGGKPAPVYRDALGQMRIDAPPGSRDVLLRFEPPLENEIGRVVSLGSVLVAMLMAAGSRTFGQRGQPQGR